MLPLLKSCNREEEIVSMFRQLLGRETDSSRLTPDQGCSSHCRRGSYRRRRQRKQKERGIAEQYRYQSDINIERIRVMLGTLRGDVRQQRREVDRVKYYSQMIRNSKIDWKAGIDLNRSEQGIQVLPSKDSSS